MAVIPEFLSAPGDYPHRVLPASAHPADLAEVKSRLVDDFANSTRRPILFDGLRRWAEEVSQFGIPMTCWVDGSFVEGKQEPDDVDIWSFCDLQATPLRDAFLATTNGREGTKPQFHCHTFCWLNFPPGHPQEFMNERTRIVAQRTWGFTRPQDKHSGHTYAARYPKGFVVLALGVGAPDIRTDGVWP